MVRSRTATRTIDGYTVNFVTFVVDIDGTPLLRGLPGDVCLCPHHDEGEEFVDVTERIWITGLFW